MRDKKKKERKKGAQKKGAENSPISPPLDPRLAVSSEDNEVDNRLDKIHFANYVKEAKSLIMIILYLYSAISIAIQ